MLLHSAQAALRLQEGYGVNTFKLINAEGQENLCKFHVLPKEGGISCPDYATTLPPPNRYPFNVQCLPSPVRMTSGMTKP